MQFSRRRIVLGTIILCCILFVTGYLIISIEQHRTTSTADLYKWVAPHPHALMIVNKPEQLRNFFFKDSKIKESFAEKVPDVFIHLLEEKNWNSPILFSFHESGTVGYMQPNSKEQKAFESYVKQTKAAGFDAEKQQIGNISFFYYPASEERFFGYFLIDGTVVCSYSKKLLESVAASYTNKKLFLPIQAERELKKADKSSTANILLYADLLNLYVTVSESQVWRIKNRWLNADLFPGEGQCCFFSTLPYYTELDSLYTPLADTLALRIKESLPELNLSIQTRFENKLVYYTGCYK